MRLSNLKKQRGAILAFSLVMLLLLTLSGTRMIQQNKQQLEIANNVRQLTQEFANGEAAVAVTKTILNGGGDSTFGIAIDLAHNNCLSTDLTPCVNNYFPDDSKLPIFHPRHQCTPTASYKQQVGLAGVTIDTDSIKATILSVSCLSPSQQCTSYDKTTKKLTCHPKSGDVNCTGKTIEEVAALFSDVDYCYQPYDPLCENPNGGSNPAVTTSANAIENYNPNPRCRSEPPTVLPEPACPKEVYKIDVIATSANGTTREIISDHVVGCGT